MTGYVYVGESINGFTKDRIYYLREGKSINEHAAFSNNKGKPDGCQPYNHVYFKPVEEMKNEQLYLHYQVTFETRTTGNYENFVKLYSIKENESLEERINKEIKDNPTLKLKQVKRL